MRSGCNLLVVGQLLAIKVALKAIDNLKMIEHIPYLGRTNIDPAGYRSKFAAHC